MGKERSRVITEADKAAAARLKAIWEAMPDRPTQQQLADGWDGGGDANQSLISQYMTGRIALNYRAVLAFARMLGVEPEAIRSDLPEQRRIQKDEESDWPGVLGYSQAVGLGSGPEAQEWAETHKLKFRADSLSRKGLAPGSLAVMYGSGDSMLPRIRPGDAILFDQADTRPRDGYVYVVMASGAAGKEYQAKRCMILDEIVYFACDNPAGDHNWRKPKRMDDKRSPVQIIGRVRWIGSWED